MVDVRVSPVVVYSDVPQSFNVSVTTPERIVVVPVSGQPTLPSYGLNLGARFPFGQYKGIVANAGVQLGAGFGSISTYSAAGTLGGVLQIPDSPARITLDVGLTGWKIEESQAKLSTVGGLAAAGIETPISDRWSAFATISGATDTALSQFSAGLGASYNFSGPVEKKGGTAKDSPVDAKPQVPVEIAEAYNALERERASAETVLNASAAIESKVRSIIQDRSGDLVSQLDAVGKLVSWVSLDKSTDGLEFGLPAIERYKELNSARQVLVLPLTHHWVMAIVKNYKTALTRVVQVAANLTALGQWSLFNELLAQAQKTRSNLTPQTLEIYKTALSRFVQITNTLLDENMRLYLPEGDVGALTSARDKVLCLQDGKKCNNVNGLDMSLSLPALEKAARPTP